MMDDNQGQEPKIHVDSDWKNQAQAEKDKLRAVDEQSKTEAEGGRGELPPAEFKTLVGTLASNAVMSLGGMQHPETGQIMIDIEGAKLYIDLLDILQEKTKGNLDEEETQYLEQIAHELRMRFVDISKAIAAQMAQSPGGEPNVGGPSTVSPIIQP